VYLVFGSNSDLNHCVSTRYYLQNKINGKKTAHVLREAAGYCGVSRIGGLLQTWQCTRLGFHKRLHTHKLRDCQHIRSAAPHCDSDFSRHANDQMCIRVEYGAIYF